MNIVPFAALLGGFFVLIATFVIAKNKSLEQKYSVMDEKQLVYANVFAKKMMKVSLIVAFIIPIPFCFLIPLISNKLTFNVISSLIILSIMTSIVIFWLFWRIVGITESELKARKKV